MTHYHAPLTFEQKVEVVLEGIFLDDEMRKDVTNKIKGEVERQIKLHKLSTEISTIQNVVTLVLFHKIME